MRIWAVSCAALVAVLALLVLRVRLSGADVAPSAPMPGPMARPPQLPAEPDAALPVLVEAHPPALARQLVTDTLDVTTLEPLLEQVSDVTQLALLVLDVDGAPWPHGRLIVEHSLQVQPHAPRGREQEEQRIRLGSDGRALGINLGRVNLVSNWIEWRTDREGRAELSGLPTEGALELRALDAGGGVGGRWELPPLAPGEGRELTLRLERRAWPLEGRCTDPEGAPLSAAVEVVYGAATLELRSDAEGRFEFPPMFAEEIELTARRSGLVRHVHLVALPSPPLALEFEVARILHVTLVDGAGRPFTLRELRAMGPHGDKRIDTYAAVHGEVHEFDSMPWVPVTLYIEGCGGRPTLDVDARAESVRWVLPRPGEATFEWSPSTPALGAQIQFELEHLADGVFEPVETRRVYRGQPIPRWRLFAGRYRVTVHADTNETPGALRPIGASQVFDVRSDESTRVSVGG